MVLNISCDPFETPMKKIIKFKKYNVIRAILIFLFILMGGIWFVKDPDIFIRNRWMTAIHVQILGVLNIVLCGLVLCSLIAISTRKVALIITSEYLIDNSRFESLGKIYWNEITGIEKTKKYSLKISIKDSQSKNKKNNLLKRIVFNIQNSTNRGSIIISSGLLDCDREEIYETMSIAHENSIQ